MILGESHYCCDAKAGVSFTKDVISDHLAGSKRLSFFTKIAGVILRCFAEHGKGQSWAYDQILFYNYLQACVSGPRVTPTEKMWADSEEPFVLVPNEYKVDLLLVCGKRLWNCMTSEGSAKVEACPDDLRDMLFAYHRGSSSAYCTLIKHPSGGGFSYDSATARLNSLLTWYRGHPR
jgi:hypothetical protein